MGALVDDSPGGVVVEVVGPAGETLDLLDLLELPAAHVRRAEPR
jgi:hypothetical protein